MLACIMLLLSVLIYSGMANNIHSLPAIGERGVVLTNGDGNDLIGVSSMDRIRNEIFVSCEFQPDLLYFGRYSEILQAAMQPLTDNTYSMQSVHICYAEELPLPLLGRGKGYEAFCFWDVGERVEVFFSYESDTEHFLYHGDLLYTNGSPDSILLSRRYKLPPNPPDTYHNVGWEAIAVDPETHELFGVFEDRGRYKKMVFCLDLDHLNDLETANSDFVEIEYRVTDMTRIGSGEYLSTIYIWTEEYENMDGQKIRSETPQFRLVKFTRIDDGNNSIHLEYQLLKSFQRPEFDFEGEALNFEGIVAVHSPKGILIVNDNDPPYFKFRRAMTPPSILRYLQFQEIGLEN